MYKDNFVNFTIITKTTVFLTYSPQKGVSKLCKIFNLEYKLIVVKAYKINLLINPIIYRSPFVCITNMNILKMSDWK